MPKSNTTTHATDQHVGARVRMRRMLLGISQTDLGKAAGITFQQVQKYEKGTNRISASRLVQFADVLRVPVAFFFDQSVGDRGPATVADAFFGTRDGVKLATAFMAIKEPAQRRKIVELVESLAP